VIAGVTNGLVYLPQGIGYAIVAGVNPIYGLYAGFLPPIVGAFTTGSVYMQVIATNELCTPIGRIGHELSTGFTVEKLFAMTLLVGVFAVAGGFVSRNDLLKVEEILTQPRQIDGPTLAFGTITIVSALSLLHTRFKRFVYVIVLLVVSVAVHVFQAHSVILAGAHHQVRAGFPRPVMPDLTAIPELFVPALTLAILGLSFGAGVAQSYPSLEGKIGDPSRDFFGQGMANLVSSFFQCMPSGGSMSRTAYIVETGAATRWANVFTGLTVLAMLLTVVRIIEHVPLTVLAGILMVIGYTAIDFGRLRLVWRINHTERFTMVLTAALTLLLSPPIAILIGMIMSFINFIRSSASSINLSYLVRDQHGQFVERVMPDHFSSGAVTVLRLHGYLFFAGIDAIEARLQRFLQARNAALVLSFAGYTSVGSNGLIFLERFAQQMVRAGNCFMLADVSNEIKREFERTGVMSGLKAENVFAARSNPGESIALAFEVAQNRILDPAMRT
jgi:SulP family sulfate permease